MRYLLLIFGLIVYTLPAQTYEVEYTYNSSGGRTVRRVIELSPPPAKMAEVKMLEQNKNLSTLEEEWFTGGEVKIYPNPTEGALTVDLSGIRLDDSGTMLVELILYDAAGRLLQTHRVEGGIQQLDLSAYPKGWYLLLLRGGAEQREFKIIKK